MNKRPAGNGRTSARPHVDDESLRPIEQFAADILATLGLHGWPAIFKLSHLARSEQKCARAAIKALEASAYARGLLGERDIGSAIAWAACAGSWETALYECLASRRTRSKAGHTTVAMKRATRDALKPFIEREARKIRAGREDLISKLAAARTLKLRFPEELAAYTETTIRLMIK